MVIEFRQQKRGRQRRQLIRLTPILVDDKKTVALVCALILSAVLRGSLNNMPWLLFFMSWLRTRNHSTVVQESHESRHKHWATCSSIHSHRSVIRLLRTTRLARALRCAHSFARSLTLLICSLAHFAHSLACSLRSWESE